MSNKLKKIYHKLAAIKKQLIIKKRKAAIKLLKRNDYIVVKYSRFFNSKWYKKTYKLNKKEDAVKHYLTVGWRNGNNPSKNFSTINYLFLYSDVRELGVNPLVHYEKYGKYENKKLRELKFDSDEEKIKIKRFKKIQDERIEKQYSKDVKKLILFLVPEIDFVGGGVMSICSIAEITKANKKIHDSEVILATMPNIKTFCNYTKFTSKFDVFRFEQLMDYFENLEELVIHIPETYVVPFLYFVSPDEVNWIRSIKKVTANILNQNLDLMPRPRDVELLRLIIPNLTMTCAHKKYCVRQLRTSYGMPVHWLSTSNMTKYYYKTYEEKENMLVYSPDFHPLKDEIINKIKAQLPELKLVMIDNMSYEEYKKIISEAKWMITFGEGLDGYFIESTRSGTVSFAAYNNVFFNESFEGLPSIYNSYNEMLEKIVDDIKSLDCKKKFEALNKRIIDIDRKEYDDKIYVNNIVKYYKGEYTFPFEDVQKNRKERLNRKPLISIVVATYNGEKFIEKQLQSLVNLTYENKEIIISDDGSTDKTLKIVRAFANKNKARFVMNNGKHGLNENFTNALMQAKGEYIALCDQDDIWEPNKLEILLEHIDDFDAVHGGVMIIDDQDNYHPQSFMHKTYEIDKTKYYQFSDFVNENFVLGCTSLVKKELIDKVLPIPNGVIYHDWWVMLNAIKSGNGVCYVDKKVIDYRQHETNTAKSTYNSSDWFLKKRNFDNIMLEKFKNLNLQEKIKIKSDLNYCIIRDTFFRYIPNNVDAFFDSNKGDFSSEFVEVLINNLSDSK